ncbi:MAG: hypothetical protein EOP39_09250 [Rubrivivax sp.]|nr:MAG: hypothetical protein EOP39_09250 [Rubrivivax sp.]
MTEHDPLDAALRQHLQDQADLDDNGFSLRVMGALPVQVASSRRRYSRWITLAQWTLSTAAACGAAALFASGRAMDDAPHALAAVTLTGLLIYWSIPSRWSRG